jgi:hypothetical protein
MNREAHSDVSRKGGLARSSAKTAANRAKAAAFWRDVRAGRRPSPRRQRTRLTLEDLSSRLSGYCLQNGVVRLDTFGPVAGGEGGDGPIGLLATVSMSSGKRLASLRADMAVLLGRPVNLLTRDGLEQGANPFRRLSILADATPIYVGADGLQHRPDGVSAPNTA